MIILAKSKFNWLGGSDKKIFKFQPMRTHYGPWQPCWISNQHQKHNEHFWQVWLKSVQPFREEDLNVKS
jgi:hypothetical protein